MVADGSFNEKDSFNLLKKNISKLERIFADFKNIKSNDEDSIEKLERYLQKIPGSSDLATQVEAIRNDLDIYIKKTKKERANNFSAVFNDYLDRIQKSQRPYRLIDKNTLRAEMLQIQANPQKASVQFLFNKKVLMPWKHVLCADDVVKYENECLGMLKKAVIPEQEIEDVFYRAYLNALRKRRKEKSFNPSYVPIVDFYTEVQVELFRQKLLNKASGADNITISFPIWAFLYNLDRYRKMRNISENKRLFLETGSQVETKKNGMVLNGLDPKADYKMFCYIRGSVANQ